MKRCPINRAASTREITSNLAKRILQAPVRVMAQPPQAVWLFDFICVNQRQILFMTCTLTLP